MARFLAARGRAVAVVNLDPANDRLPYAVDIDVSELVNLAVRLSPSVLKGWENAFRGSGSRGCGGRGGMKLIDSAISLSAPPLLTKGRNGNTELGAEWRLDVLHGVCRAESGLAFSALGGVAGEAVYAVRLPRTGTCLGGGMKYLWRERISLSFYSDLFALI